VACKEVFKDELQKPGVPGGDDGVVYVLIRVFSSLANSNRLHLTTQLKATERTNFAATSKQTRRFWQMLFDAAAVAATANPRTRRTPSRSRMQTRTPTPSAGPRTAATISTPITVDTPFPTTEEIPTEAIHVPAAAKHRSDMGRPNLHIGLHYAQAVEDYGTGNNLTVWVGETKHKTSKSYITHTNHLNAERDLLRHEAEEQTIRVMINGGFRETEADRRVSDMVRMVNMQVPSLFRRVLPHSEQQDDEEDGIKVIPDPAHESPSGINRIKSWYCREKLNLPLRPLDSDGYWNEDMKTLLRNAYDQDYKIKVTLLGNRILRWYAKFSFDDL
jgi:hypothetical protein